MNVKPSPREPALHLQTLGGFHIWREGDEIAQTAGGREKAIHLLQFFVTLWRRPLHYEAYQERLLPKFN